MYKLNNESVQKASKNIIAFFLELTKIEIKSEEARNKLLSIICSFIESEVKIDTTPCDIMSERAKPRVLNASEFKTFGDDFTNADIE